MQIREKIVIREKQSVDIAKEKFRATLRWKASVDLDLYAIFATGDREGSVYYGNRSYAKETAFPFITLDRDAGVGDRGGNNVENIVIHKPTEHDHILIVANIFNKTNANFAGYDGAVEVMYEDGTVFEVPLSSKSGGNWCIIAHFDNSRAQGVLNNVNSAVHSIPTVRSFLNRPTQEPEPEKPGFFSKVASFLKG